MAKTKKTTTARSRHKRRKLRKWRKRKKAQTGENGESDESGENAKTAKTAKTRKRRKRRKRENGENGENGAKTARTTKTVFLVFSFCRFSWLWFSRSKARQARRRKQTGKSFHTGKRENGFLGFLGFLVFSVFSVLSSHRAGHDAGFVFLAFSGISVHHHDQPPHQLAIPFQVLQVWLSKFHPLATLAGAMPQKGSVIEEHMVGQDLHVTKPMRFKVSVPCLWNIAIVSILSYFANRLS